MSLADDGARPPPRAWPGLLMLVLLSVFGAVGFFPLGLGLRRMGLEVSWEALALGMGGVVCALSLLVAVQHARSQPKPWIGSVLLAPGVPAELAVQPVAGEQHALWLEVDLAYAVRPNIRYELRLRLEVHDGTNAWAQTYAYEWQSTSRPRRRIGGAIATAYTALPNSVQPEVQIDVSYGDGRYQSNVRLCTLPPTAAHQELSAMRFLIRVEPLEWAEAAHLRIFVSPA